MVLQDVRAKHFDIVSRYILIVSNAVHDNLLLAISSSLNLLCTLQMAHDKLMPTASSETTHFNDIFECTTLRMLAIVRFSMQLAPVMTSTDHVSNNNKTTCNINKCYQPNTYSFSEIGTSIVAPRENSILPGSWIR